MESNQGPEAEQSALEHTEHREIDSPRMPRIYVASLSDYNAGRLHGAWLDATAEYEDLATSVGHMLALSPEPIAEEWAIHDYENFGGLRLSEYEPLSIVSIIGQGIAEHGPAFAAWADIVEKDPDQLSQFEDAYQGEWASIVDYAENLVDDLGIDAELDRHFDSLRPYIKVDCEALARDMELSGDYYAKEADNGSVYVFTAL